jgi:hypothetical protein
MLKAKCNSLTSNRLARIYDYVENRREIEEQNPIPIGSPVGQNELPLPTGSQTQPSEPIGDKNRITNMALKRARCAGLGKDR